MGAVSGLIKRGYYMGNLKGIQLAIWVVEKRILYEKY